jgi:large subunit ribosomal protein L24
VAATRFKPKYKIRKGDTVQVLTGKDLGRRGTVLEVLPERGRVVVERINLVKKHSRPRPVRGTRGAQMTPGGVIEQEAALDISNVAIVCPSCNAPTRIGFRIRENGDKVRVCRRPGCDGELDG